MPRFDLVHRFVENAAAVRDKAELSGLLDDAAVELGFHYFALVCKPVSAPCAERTRGSVRRERSPERRRRRRGGKATGVVSLGLIGSGKR